MDIYDRCHFSPDLHECKDQICTQQDYTRDYIRSIGVFDLETCKRIKRIDPVIFVGLNLCPSKPVETGA